MKLLNEMDVSSYSGLSTSFEEMNLLDEIYSSLNLLEPKLGNDIFSIKQIFDRSDAEQKLAIWIQVLPHGPFRLTKQELFACMFKYPKHVGLYKEYEKIWRKEQNARKLNKSKKST